MSLIASGLVVTLLGRLLLTHFEEELRVNGFALLGLSFVLGLGVFTWSTYLMLLVGGKLTLASVSLLAMALVLLAYRLRRRNQNAVSPENHFVSAKVADWGLAALLLPLFGLCLYVAFQAPNYWSDSIYYYDGLGRVLSIEGTLYAGALKSAVFTQGLQSLHLQMFHAVSYLFAEDHVAVVYAGYYASLVLIFAFVRWDGYSMSSRSDWRRVLSSFPWRILTLGVATTPFIFGMGYVVLSTLPGAVYFLAAVILWKRFMQSPSREVGILSGTMAALAAWTRLDATFFFLPVTLITLAAATVNDEVRHHLWAFILPPVVMDFSRYLFVGFSGQLIWFAGMDPLPYLNFWTQLLVVGYTTLLHLGGETLRERLAWLVLGTAAVGLAVVGALSVMYFDGVTASAMQLWRLTSDPVWGWTGVLVILAAFSPSLFLGRTERLLLLVIMTLIAMRILMFAGIVDLNASDASITQAGNRILLRFVWLPIVYWASCSRELRRLFVFGGMSQRSDSHPSQSYQAQ